MAIVRLDGGLSRVDPSKSEHRDFESQSVSEFNHEMSRFTAPLRSDSTDDDAILSDPNLQYPGVPMPSKVIRKSLPDGEWTQIYKMLERKGRMHVPTVDETSDISTLEAVHTSDLEIGNVLLAVCMNMSLSDLYRDDGKGFFYFQSLYCFEVTGTEPQHEFDTQFCTRRVKEVKLNHPASSEGVLRHCGGQGYIFDPLIARGLGINFKDIGDTGRSPYTAAVQEILVFKNMAELNSFLVRGKIVATVPAAGDKILRD